jgi:hypothetical protein
MASLKRSESGAYTARKGIPKDVQEEYARLYGQRWEAKQTLPATLKPQEAKAQYGEWLTEIETRIVAIRSRLRGDRQSLSQKQVNALAGEWYRWFVAQHEENPGQPERWRDNFWALISALEEYAPESVTKAPWKNLDWTRELEVRNGIRPTMAKEARTDQFLADRALSLTEDSYNSFLDCVLDEYIAGTLLLERRAEGDYSSDERLQQFPAYERAPKRPTEASGRERERRAVEIGRFTQYKTRVQTKSRSCSEVQVFQAFLSVLAVSRRPHQAIESLKGSISYWKTEVFERPKVQKAVQMPFPLASMTSAKSGSLSVRKGLPRRGVSV